MLNTTLNTTTKMFQNGLDSAHKVWLAGLGTVDTVQETVQKEGSKLVKEGDKLLKESNKMFDRMVERGRGIETKTLRKVEKETDKAESRVERQADNLGTMIDRRVTEALHRFGIPTRKEIQTLTTRVEELNAKVTLMLETKTVAADAAPARTVYHVTAADEGWKVVPEGATAAVSVAATKEEALNAARDLAKAQEPSQVVVHKMDGKIQTSYTYGEIA